MNKKLGVQVVYLFNSGFAVKLGERVLIFDYYNPMSLKRHKGPDSGVIDPEELRDLDVTVFASHAHIDHFTPAVLKWGREIHNLRYVLSYDIKTGQTPNVTKVYPNTDYKAGGISVRTLKST
ncbi:MAG: MBL fold metallo-hydrolase, partial [Clostridiales bacterium]|nr:MBL fold metallo-hydrolase [Clostridiales bacterium]